MFAFSAPALARLFHLPARPSDLNRELAARIADVFESDEDLADIPSLCFMVRDATVHLHSEELSESQRSRVHDALYGIEGVDLVVDGLRAASIATRLAA